MLEMLPLKFTVYFMTYYICGVKNLESESFEIINLDDEEASPFYNTVVFSDIADMMTDLDPGYYEQFRNRGSEIDVNIEDLLSEYQSYLDKKMKKEKNGKSRKLRNKKSLFDQNLINNLKDYKYNEYFYPTERDNFIPKLKALDIIMPYDTISNQKPSNGFETKPGVVKKDISQIQLFDEHKGPINSKLRNFLPPIPSSCICHKGEIPCDCGCKECLFPFIPETIFDLKTFSRKQSTRFIPDAETERKLLTLSLKSLLFSKLDDDFYPSVHMKGIIPQEQSKENTLNIHLNLEIKIPNQEKSYGNNNINKSQILASEYAEKANSKIVPIATAPSPFSTFPNELIELELMKKHKPIYREPQAFHSGYNHQKRKIKHINKKHQNFSGTNKTMKSKENIKTTEKSLNYNTQVYQEMVTETGTTFETVLKENNISDIFNNTSGILTETTTSSIEPNFKKSTQEMLATSLNYNMVILSNSTDTKENILKKHAEHGTVNMNNTQINDVGIQFQDFVSTTKRKRSITAKDIKKDYFPIQVTLKKTESNSNDKYKSYANSTKVSDKVLFLDDQLLYWPTEAVITRMLHDDITTLIVKKETKKSKFNLSRESIRDNHKKALEQAVFGDVDWNDMNVVTPVFMSFVGKYLTGVLTFCSKENCHSMKCDHKLCVHRVCAPVDRQNHMAHCLGSNHTDSAVSMESIMDLPSNTVLEVVDILQKRLHGKLYGKVTLCANTKCITMAAVKKSFYKIKCAIKELNSIGHCPITKKVYN